MEDALGRLGWVSLAVLVSSLGVYLLGGRVPDWIDPRSAPASYRVAMLTSAALAAAMFSLIRIQRLASHFLMDLSLVYQVAMAFFISLAENAAPRLEGEVLRGNSSIAVWIVLFALTVPASFGKALLAAVSTALMGPMGLAAQILMGNVPMPDAARWLVMFSTPLLMAVGATLLARQIYHLGAQVEEARQMGSYQLVEQLGSGGMGEVWLARHRMLARQAAIKLIRAGTLANPAATRRFEREAAATASLHSPHTVALYDYGVTDDGRFYYVMELLTGLDLETFVKRHGPVPAERAIYILEQICDSLAEAHYRGLTHRDIKPRNILLCRLGVTCDFVKVLDFGLVKIDAGEGTQLTGEGQAAGTPAFMAPEVALGKSEVDGRADLYGLGCVAYWLVTGDLVFPASSSAAMIVAHVQESPVPPSERTDNEVPEGLERLILDCLRKDAGDRPQTAREVAHRLRECSTERSWTAQKAEEWWRMHVPEGMVMRGFDE